MKKLIYLVMSIAMSLFAADASAQYIPVTTPGSCIVDGSGSTITAGTMIVVGTDANDNPIPYRAGTSAMATTAPISRSIVNGALLTSLQLADPASTSPTNVLYRFVIQDNLSKKITVYKQIIVAINDLGTNFNFCKMNPLPFTTQIQFAAAPFSFSGDWNLLGHLSVALSSTFAAQILASDGTKTLPAYGFSGVAGVGFYRFTATSDIVLAASSLNQILWANNLSRNGSGMGICWSSNIDPTLATSDTCIFRNAAGIAQFGTSESTLNSAGEVDARTHGITGSTSGKTSLVTDATASGNVTVKAGTYIVIGDTLTQAMTNKTFTGAALGNSIELLTSGCTPQGPTASINGTGAAADIFTCSLLANTVENAKILHVICSATHDTGTANVAVAINLNGVQVLAASTGTAASQSVALEAYILRTDTTTAQTWGLGMNTTGTTQPFSVAVTGLAFTSNQTLNCQFNVASGDHMTGRVWAPMSIQ